MGRSRGWFAWVGAIAALWLALVGGLVSSARAQVGTVTPLDVATPTPTLHPAFVPTATPLPLGETNFVPGGYRVQPGDTLLTIALEMGVDLAETYCLVAPDFSPTTPLVIGDVLTLLPAGSRCHTVMAGETLDTLGRLYTLAPQTIVADPWNGPTLMARVGDVLPVGWHLRIPLNPTSDSGVLDAAARALPLLLRQPVDSDLSPVLAIAAGRTETSDRPMGGPQRPAFAPLPADWAYGSGNFAWPLYGWLSQDFHDDHRAIDVAADEGTLVTAADRGVVIRAGWNSQGYGQFVIIDHNIDYLTLYAHLSEILVQEGDIVAQGQVLGRVGSTGNSTGPHLHFEIRDFGQRVDPVPLLLRR